ncbi:hypothetical protein M3J09_011532 [Ascochyta lentis]
MVNHRGAFEFVIAHHNEDLSWLSEVSNDVTVYWKGLPPTGQSQWKETHQLTNIGRESHTYLHHIVTHYEILAEVTLFSQGDVHNNGGAMYPHVTVSSAKEMKQMALASSSIPFMIFTPEVTEFDHWNGIQWTTSQSTLWWFQQKGRNMAMAQLTPAEFWTQYLETPHPLTVYYGPGATFSVRATAIRTRPKSFYERLLAVFIGVNHINPEYGHYMERFWAAIFLDGNRNLQPCDEDDLSNSRTLKILALSSPQLPFTYEEYANRLMKEKDQKPTVVNGNFYSSGSSRLD